MAADHHDDHGDPDARSGLLPPTASVAWSPSHRGCFTSLGRGQLCSATSNLARSPGYRQTMISWTGRNIQLRSSPGRRLHSSPVPIGRTPPGSSQSSSARRSCSSYSQRAGIAAACYLPCRGHNPVNSGAGSDQTCSRRRLDRHHSPPPVAVDQMVFHSKRVGPSGCRSGQRAYVTLATDLTKQGQHQTALVMHS
jgi:hypothetical protein